MPDTKCPVLFSVSFQHTRSIVKAILIYVKWDIAGWFQMKILEVAKKVLFNYVVLHKVCTKTLKILILNEFARVVEYKDCRVDGYRL